MQNATGFVPPDQPSSSCHPQTTQRPPSQLVRGQAEDFTIPLLTFLSDVKARSAQSNDPTQFPEFGPPMQGMYMNANGPMIPTPVSAFLNLDLPSQTGDSIQPQLPPPAWDHFPADFAQVVSAQQRPHSLLLQPLPAFESGSSSSSADQGQGQGPESPSSLASDNSEQVAHERMFTAEEKRRRSTAASARFRIRKKQRKINLERSVSDLTSRAEDLEREVADLRRENGWLKDIIMLKRGQVASGDAIIQDAPPPSLDPKGSAPNTEERDSDGESEASVSEDEGKGKQKEK